MEIYKDCADLVTVYIEEAHAADEWLVNTEGERTII